MVSILEETRATVEHLFSPENASWWRMAYPKDSKVTTLAPSGKESQNLISLCSCRNDMVPYLQNIKDELLRLYFSNPVSETFWTTISDHVMQGISGPLFSYQDKVESSNEATLRTNLIRPVLCDLTRHLSHLPLKPPEDCSIFTASLEMEHKVPLHGGAGRPASVDFCIVLRHESGSVISAIPGEAKVVITDQHLKQLSMYMWKIATSEPYSGRCVMGLLMNDSNYQIAFCPLMFQDKKAVPITLVSPQIQWRNVSVSTTAVSKSTLLLLSAMLLSNIEAKDVGTGFAEPEFAYLKDTSDKFYETPLTMDIAPHDMKTGFSALERDMKSLKKEMMQQKVKYEQELTKLNEEFKLLKEADMLQKMMIYSVQGILAPRRPSPFSSPSGIPFLMSPFVTGSGRKRRRHSSEGDSTSEL